LAVLLAYNLEFISQGQIDQARRFSGIAQDEQQRAQEAAFKPAKWAKQPFNTHGYKEIEMAVFEYIKLITTKHYEHLCMCIDVTQQNCGSQALVRLDTNLLLAATAPSAISRLNTRMLFVSSTRMTL